MTATDPTLRPRPTGSAKSMLLTVLGELVRPNGASVWTGTLVDALGALDYSDRNVRQAIARLGDDGVIEPERHGRRTRWHITAEGDRLLQTGAERIYRFGRRAEPWDGRWLVVVCSIPEAQREKRRRLQTQLTFTGFGFVSPTVAISANTAAEDTANEVLDGLDLTDLALVLIAETGSLTPDQDLVERSWDLDALSDAYRELITTFSEIRPDGPEASFCELVRLVHAWRRFPFFDPELPAELLPAGWAGTVARHLFDDARVAWSTEATAHYKGLEAANDQ